MGHQLQNFRRDRSGQGFTLIETLIVLLMIGIMAAIATPSLLGFLAKAKVNSALGRLDGMLKSTQREAVRKSQDCTLFLPDNDTENAVISSTCSTTGSETLNDVTIKYNNANSKKVNFTYRGGTSPLRTIVLYSKDTDYKRCLVISNGIGMMRKGQYTGSISDISADDCQTSI